VVILLLLRLSRHPYSYHLKWIDGWKTRRKKKKLALGEFVAD
jgi:allantoicase